MSDDLNPAGRGAPPPDPPVAVAGRLDRSIADFERSCLVHIDEEQRKAGPDNALIALLCDAVRLAREQQAPRIEFDNHHNARLCPYCNPAALHPTQDGQ